MITEEGKRSILIRGKARAFASEVKASGGALHVPEEIVDWLKDSEFIGFFHHLGVFGLVQRSDKRWEKK